MIPYSMLRADYSKYEATLKGFNIKKFRETCAKNKKNRKKK